MYCGRCGTQNEDNARFCSECGADLSPVNPAAVPVQPVQPVQPIQPAPAVVPIAPTHIIRIMFCAVSDSMVHWHLSFCLERPRLYFSSYLLSALFNPRKGTKLAEAWPKPE